MEHDAKLDEAVEAVPTPDGSGSETSDESEQEPVCKPENAPEQSAAGSAPAAQQEDERYQNKYAKRYRAELELLKSEPDKNYLLDRVFKQMAYLDEYSAKYKKRYHTLTILCIVLNGIVPFVVLLEGSQFFEPYVKYAVSALSTTAGIITAILALKMYRELWIQYRLSHEQLERAVSMYFLKAGAFAGKNAEDHSNILFTVCEDIITSQHTQWIELSENNDAKK